MRLFQNSDTGNCHDRAANALSRDIIIENPPEIRRPSLGCPLKLRISELRPTENVTNWIFTNWKTNWSC